MLECESPKSVVPMKAHDASLDTIQCPECGHAIPVSEALSHQIAERARAQSEAEIASLRTALKEQDKKTAEACGGTS